MNTRLIKTLRQVEELLQQAPALNLNGNQKMNIINGLRPHSGTSDTLPQAGLIKTYTATGSPKRQQRKTNGFTQKYTQANKRLLAEADQLHNDLNGYATKKLKHGDERCERLAGISTSHRYNLRKSKAYRAVRTHETRTQSVKRAIGEYRRP